MKQIHLLLLSIFLLALLLSCDPSIPAPKIITKTDTIKIKIVDTVKIKEKPYIPVHRYYVLAAQSNGGIFGTADLGLSIARTWNDFTYKFEDIMDVSKQFYTNLGGVIVPLSKLLKKKYPKDSLYFLQYHKGGSYITDWSPYKQYLFDGLEFNLDHAYATVKPDSVTFIWIQGENDALTLPLAMAYENAERQLFTYLRDNYHVNTFIDCKLPKWSVTLPYRDSVNVAKIRVSKDFNSRLVVTDSLTYNIDKVHYSLTAMLPFAKQIMKQINSH